MSELKVEICKIDDIIKHPNAEKLAIAVIKGWNCIIGLNNYKKGDLCVYCPPDSVIPQNLIESLNLTYLKKNGRVSTVKLRGAISQGLILDVPKGKSYKEGDDVAKELGITKYEVPEPSYQTKGCQVSKKHLNPLFNVYTDINNIKHYNNLFQPEDEVVISEKIHGSSFRASNLPIHYPNTLLGKIKKFIDKNIFKKEFEFVYGSHKVQKTWYNKNKGYYNEDFYGQVAKKYNLDKIIPENIILYGEVYGKGVQDLTYGLDGVDVVFFDAKDTLTGKYLDYEVFFDLVVTQLGLPIVPILYKGKYGDTTLAEHTNGKSKLCPTQIGEGCVVKPLKEVTDLHIGRKILKSISEEYLLRKGGTEYK